MTDLTQDPQTATAPSGTPLATTDLTVAWGQYFSTALAVVASPIATTVMFFYQLYAPGILQTLEPPQKIHDLFMAAFAELEVISRGGALTISVHSGPVAYVLKSTIAEFPVFEHWLLTQTDPWIKEELQAYGILPKA